MKSKIAILMIIVILFNNFSLGVAMVALADGEREGYDHEELFEYDGYGKAVYEAVSEATYYTSGRYTENKKYARDTIENFRDYANSFIDEYYDIPNFIDLGGIQPMYEKMGATALTVGDWVKRLFGEKEKYDKQANPEPPIDIISDEDLSVYESFMYYDSTTKTVKLNEGVKVELVRGNQKVTVRANTAGWRIYVNNCLDNNKVYQACMSLVHGSSAPLEIVDTYANRQYYVQKENSMKGIIENTRKLGYQLIVSKDEQLINMPSESTYKPRPSTTINNYITNGGMDNKPIVMPEPRPFLSCPNGTMIQMSVSGSTFLASNGEVMIVNKDGTAHVNSEICKLGWEKPKIEYVNNNVVMETSEGDYINIENGKKIDKDAVIEDTDVDDGCGFICGIGKLLAALADIIKFLGSLVAKIIDGLLELFKKLFLPASGYWSSKFAETEEKMLGEKSKNMLTQFEGIQGAGGGTFEDITVSMMGVDGLEVVDADSVNSILGNIHSWVRGVIFPLLALYNLNQVYKLIRGSSLTEATRLNNNRKAD